MIDISKRNKAEVLAALYNASRPQGMGFIQYNLEPMTVEQAALILEEQQHFDYLGGRVMKISLDGDTLDPRLYDRDNGEGAAQRALDASEAEIAQIHKDGVQAAAAHANNHLHEKSRINKNGITLGLGDHADVLKAKIEKAKE